MNHQRNMRRLFESLEPRQMLTGSAGPALFSDNFDLSESRRIAVIGPQHSLPARITVTLDPTFTFWKGGNVSAEVIDSILTIRGDDVANLVEIIGSEDGSITVKGSWLYTSINGQNEIPIAELSAFAADPPVFTDVTGIEIELGGGADELFLGGTKLPALDIKTGAGDDRVVLGGLAEDPYRARIANELHHPVKILVQGNLLLDAGAGDDQLIPFAQVNGDIAVQMGVGRDSYIELVYPTLTEAKTRSELTSTGSRVIDLGVDQDTDIYPENWRDDAELVDQEKVEWFLPVLFEQMATAEANGTLTLGGPWTPSLGSRAYDIDGSGRLLVHFSFLPGFGELIDRVRDRGLQLIETQIDIDTGFGAAWIHEEELALFANLPGLIKVAHHGAIDTMFRYVDPNAPPFPGGGIIIGGPVVTPNPNPGGNVTAEVVEGVLKIRGDAQGNKIEIRTEGNSTTIGVVSHPNQTTVNGREAWILPYIYSYPVFENVLRIDIDLGDGDDSVTIAGNQTMPPLDVRTGAGDDIVRIGGNSDDLYALVAQNHLSFGYLLQVNGDVKVDTGDGDDQLLPFAHVAGSIEVQMGAGNDSYIELIYNARYNPSLDRTPYQAFFTAIVTRTIDLGSDQDAEVLADNWRTNPVYHKIDDQVVAAVATSELVEIEFVFLPGFAELINRLETRGVEIEAYTVTGGLGRASIREADLRLFTNLPGLMRISLAGTRSHETATYPWDYEQQSPDSPASIGPVQLDKLRSGPADLLESFYGSGVLGPRQLGDG